MQINKGLLLIGSPKQKNSTSYALGNYLVQKLSQYTFDTYYATELIKGEKDYFIKQINEADLVIISFPLYVDNLPAPLIEVLENIEENRVKSDKKQKLMAIVNCGFPEKFHNNVALRICKHFSDANNFHWIGGLRVGAGPMVKINKDEKINIMMKNKIKGFDLIASSIIKDENISDRAIKLVEKKMVPHFLYALVVNHGFKNFSKKCGTISKLHDKPFLKGEK